MAKEEKDRVNLDVVEFMSVVQFTLRDSGLVVCDLAARSLGQVFGRFIDAAERRGLEKAADIAEEYGSGNFPSNVVVDKIRHEANKLDL